jgi:CRP/FNR family transcriptional regulator, cyclic AMP receptor protein
VFSSYQDELIRLFAGMRNIDSVADALARTARYGKCPRRERQVISAASTRIDVPEGAVLAREGGRGRELVIVLTGGASVSSGGREISALLAGDHFGDIALLDDGISDATVVAQTPMTLAVVNPGEFTGLLDRCPTLARAVLSNLASRMRMVAAA